MARTWLATVLWASCGIVVAYALFSVPRKILELSLPGLSGVTANLASALVATAAVGICIRYYAPLARSLQAAGDRLALLDRRWWLALLICSGILVRFAWVWFFPTVQTSDHATYVVLAKKLVSGEPYFDGDSYSNWPPGLPFFLAANFFVFGDGAWVITFGNLLLYSVSVVIVYVLARAIAGEGPSRIATLIFLMWPNDIMCTGLAKKELLIVPLLTGAMLAYIEAHRVTDSTKSFWLRVIAGGLLGTVSLTQPSLVLLPATLAVYEAARGTATSALLMRIGVVIVAMCAVISPWSIRNYRVLHAIVPISTAGGDGFYSANNGLATGRYIPVYERSLEQFDEVTRSKMGYRWDSNGFRNIHASSWA